MESDLGDASAPASHGPPERFPLESEDLAAIAQLVRSHTPSMSPAELRTASSVLLALERLPLATPGLQVQFGFSTPDDDGNYAWADLTMCEDEIQLDVGERYYNPSVGGDTECRIVFESRAGSDWRNGDIYVWLGSARAIAGQGRIRARDESDYTALDELLEGSRE